MSDPIDLIPGGSVPTIPRPALPGAVVVRQTLDEVIDAIAADLLMQSVACTRAFGDFQLALSGGTTPEPLYRRLMYDPILRELPWKRTHLWLVDERRVGFEDDRSNFKMIREIIVDHSDIPREQVHPIFPLAEDPAAAYERDLRETLGWRERGHDRLDYVLLGMGADGHTASLFPRSPALVEGIAGDPALVKVNAGATVTPPDRVTMTLSMINASRLVAIMVTGATKKATVARVAAKRESAADLPIIGVSPLAGELRWYLDAEACP